MTSSCDLNVTFETSGVCVERGGDSFTGNRNVSPEYYWMFGLHTEPGRELDGQTPPCVAPRCHHCLCEAVWIRAPYKSNLFPMIDRLIDQVCFCPPQEVPVLQWRSTVTATPRDATTCFSTSGTTWAGRATAWSDSGPRACSSTWVCVVTLLFCWLLIWVCVRMRRVHCEVSSSLCVQTAASHDITNNHKCLRI